MAATLGGFFCVSRQGRPQHVLHEKTSEKLEEAAEK